MQPVAKIHDSGIDMTDMFCGCGGSTTGAKLAADGVNVRMAINHWDLAIETHNTNHPETDHDCNDVSRVDPARYPSTRMLWASPECVTHSLAGGGKYDYEYELGRAQKDLFSGEPPLPDEAAQRSRATMGDVVRFTRHHRYDIVIVENVIDIKRWPLYVDWLHEMRKEGYRHEEVFLNSMLCWPTPQSRDRIYVVFWRNGVTKPNLDFHPPSWCTTCEKGVEGVRAWRDTKLGRARWGRYQQQYDYVCPRCANLVEPYYYAALNCIDWSIKADRIGDRTRPLADKTMERIQYGLDRYGRQPLVITTNMTSGVGCRVRRAADEPMFTQPACSIYGLASPYFIETGYTGDRRASGSAEPLHAQTARQSVAMVAPPMMCSVNDFDPRIFPLHERPNGTQTTQTKWAVVMPGFLSKQYTGNHAPINLDDPAATITASDHHGVVGLPFFAEMHGTSRAKDVGKPMMCITAGGGHHALIASEAVSGFLSHYYSGGGQSSGLADAAPTVTTHDRTGLVLSPADQVEIDDCTFRMLQPHEIGAGMAFPGDYIVHGNQREQVKQYGNAVTPPAARELIKRCLEVLA